MDNTVKDDDQQPRGQRRRNFFFGASHTRGMIAIADTREHQIQSEIEDHGCEQAMYVEGYKGVGWEFMTRSTTTERRGVLGKD